MSTQNYRISDGSLTTDHFSPIVFDFRKLVFKYDEIFQRHLVTHAISSLFFYATHVLNQKYTLNDKRYILLQFGVQTRQQTCTSQNQTIRPSVTFLFLNIQKKRQNNNTASKTKYITLLFSSEFIDFSHMAKFCHDFVECDPDRQTKNFNSDAWICIFCKFQCLAKTRPSLLTPYVLPNFKIVVFKFEIVYLLLKCLYLLNF